MDERKILTANQMIGELLLGMVLYGAITFIIYRFVYAFIIKYIDISKNMVLFAFLVLILQAIMIFCIFKLANRSAFKKGTIYKDDVKKVINNIAFVVIVILLIQVLGTFSNVNTVVDEAIDEDISLKYNEHVLSYIYDDDDMSIYQVEKEKAIKNAKNNIYLYLVVVEICIILIYGLAIYLERKCIYRRAEG